MSTPYALLGLLRQGPRHGYDIKREHDDRFPAAKPLAYGQVYATLARQLRDGLVAVAEQQPGDGPERTVYALTDAGRAALQQWVHTPEPPAPHVANVLYTKVLLSLLAGEDGTEVLDGQRRAHLARMRELTEQRRRSDLPHALAAEYALVHLEADVTWLESALRRLGDLKDEVSP